jgi:hypothetical protein
MKGQIYAKKNDKTFLKKVGFGLLGGGAAAIAGTVLTLKYWTKPAVDKDGNPEFDNDGNQETEVTKAGNILALTLVIPGGLSVIAGASAIGIGFAAKELKN